MCPQRLVLRLGPEAQWELSRSVSNEVASVSIHWTQPSVTPRYIMSSVTCGSYSRDEKTVTRHLPMITEGINGDNTTQGDTRYGGEAHKGLPCEQECVLGLPCHHPFMIVTLGTFLDMCCQSANADLKTSSSIRSHLLAHAFQRHVVRWHPIRCDMNPKFFFQASLWSSQALSALPQFYNPCKRWICRVPFVLFQVNIPAL
jgi:hypothetical protein